MTATQKHHTFNLAVIAVTLGCVLAAVPFVGFARAVGFFGLMGFVGFGLLFYRRRGTCEVVADERDSAIHLRAFKFAFALFWAVFALTCALTPLVVGDGAAIPARTLPTVLFASWAFWQTALSAAVLLQYRQPA